jgi:NitT/TauT family transport system substrate-binding protein
MIRLRKRGDEMKKVTGLCFLWLVFSLWAAGGALAERPLRASYPAPTTTQLPLWIAKEAGFFAKNKLPVELVHVGSSPVAVAALFAGEIDICACGAEVGLSAYAQGYRDLAFFASLNNRLNFKIFTHPSIKNVSGLRGKRYGVTRFGGVLDFATRYFLQSSGLDPRKDVVLIQLGRVPELVQALISGSVDGATVPIPQNFVVQKLGFQELADLTQSGIRYASNAILAKRQFLQSEKSKAEDFIRSLIEATHYVKTHRQESLRVLSAYTRISDFGSLGQAYDEYVEKVWPRVPEVQPEDLKLVLEQLGEKNPALRGVNPADLIDSRAIREVVRSGIVEQLYR